jgi:hypothetical protein
MIPVKADSIRKQRTGELKRGFPHISNLKKMAGHKPAISIYHSLTA